ncbi:hypothetical protein HDIA_1998 [Hartmannibacter diazotrophicus]|uniref:Phage tail protein E n=1 Tax=Hartmannibacter diazotrophicus TaxID=1482074 RepID=A0A2C9D5V1_9HYPH|nr:phage tail assembly protein [Hartmannibacter diazotrophicus]SON55539.1 hypothetical protein HDIA_1998 [Hartmannibacter diazotrophicus]
MSKPKSATVTLEFPIEEVDGTPLETPITQLTFRRMKAKDALTMEGIDGKTEAGFALYAALAGVEPAVIAELDTDDLTAITEKVAPLMGKSGEAMLRQAMAKAAAEAAKASGETSSSDSDGKPDAP